MERVQTPHSPPDQIYVGPVECPRAEETAQPMAQSELESVLCWDGKDSRSAQPDLVDDDEPPLNSYAIAPTSLPVSIGLCESHRL